MAETKKKTKRATREWTPDLLVKAVRSRTPEENVELLKRIGLLTADGKPRKSAEAWGKKKHLSRTPGLEEA